MKPHRLLMIRRDLEKIPEYSLREGFSVRLYRPGDEESWLRIHRSADHELEYTLAMFRDRFGTDAALLAERQLYLVGPEGEPVGTGTAWFDEDFMGARFGRVHFVAIVPRWQGLGLSKPLMTRVCLRLRELGHDCTYLATSSTRTRAIRLYERFGFEPLKQNEADEAAWRGIAG